MHMCIVVVHVKVVSSMHSNPISITGQNQLILLCTVVMSCLMSVWGISVYS